MAGAQAYNSIDTYLAPYVRMDGLDYRRVKQEIQQFRPERTLNESFGRITPYPLEMLDGFRQRIMPFFKETRLRY